MKKSHSAWIYLAVAIALFGAAIHLAAIIGGASWYAFFGAPPPIVESARVGTWLAPVSAAVIAGLMALCAAYACSALGLIRHLPLLRPALAGIAALCLLRGLLLVPVALKRPDLLNTFEVVAAIIWAVAGAGFTVGFRASRAAAQRFTQADAASRRGSIQAFGHRG